MKRTALALLLWACAAFLPGAGLGDSATLHVDKVVRGDLAGDGRKLEVQFYSRGPYPVRQTKRGMLIDYVSGVAVADPAGLVLARWEAPPSTFPLSAKLSGLWSVAPRGMLITLGVNYGANAVSLYALRWNKKKLDQVGDVGGRKVSVQVMNGRLVVIQHGSYTDVPALYAWNGTGLVEASAQFPQYYAVLGARELACLNQDPIPLGGFTDCCRRALQAFSLAGMADAGVKACTEAKERLAAGAKVIPWREGETAEHLDQYRAGAIALIDELLAKYSKPAAMRSGVPLSRK